MRRPRAAAGVIGGAPERELVVLVTGGTGAVGPAVLRALSVPPLRVRCLARHSPSPSAAVPDVEYLSGDVTDAADVRRAVAGVDVVVHLAGLAHRTRPTPDEVRRYQQLNVEATATVCDSVARGSRVVLASTIAVYGSTAPQVTVDERSPTSPDTPYAQSKLAAEDVLWTRHRDGRLAGVVLRLGAVYGSHVKGNYRALLRAVARGLPVRLGSGDNVRTLVHEDDLGVCVFLAVTHPAAVGGTFNVTDGRVHAVRDILAAIYAASGRQVPRLAVPDWALRLAARVHDRTIGRAAGTAFGAQVDKFCESCAVDGGQAQRQLGFQPRVDLCEGWRRTWAEIAQRPASEAKGGI